MAENDSPLMSESSRGELMRARVGEFVEPLTRYDMNHIRLSSCAETTLPVGITQTFAIEISMADDDGVGALPGDCERVSGPKALIDRLKTMQRDSEQTSAEKLAGWDDAHGSDPYAAPAIGDVFTQVKSVGCQESCGSCHGAGKFECSVCHGKGKDKCQHCGATGETTCSSCHGRREVSCSRCGGSGQSSRQVEKHGWNSATNQKTVTYEMVYEACPSCSGRRTQPCTTCNHSGKTRCSFCLGAGSQTCDECDGSGSTTCKTCAGHGTVHRKGTVSCKISPSVRVDTKTRDQQILSDFSGLREVNQIMPLAQHYEIETSLAHLSLERDMQIVIPVTCADFTVGDRKLTVYGYGSDCKIFDYRDIGGALLSSDVEALELSLSQRNGLLPALAQMFQSEAHIDIARQSGAFLTKRRSAALEDLSAKLQGFASPDYCARVSTAIRKGMSRAYVGGLMRGPIASLIVPFLALPVNWLAWNNHFREHDFAVIVGTILLTLAAAFAGHLRAGQRLQTELSPDKAVDVPALLGKIGLARKWMILVGVFAVLVTPVCGAIGRVSAGF
jgi:hypothetical protein